MRLIDADAFKKYIIKGFEEMKSQFKTEFYLDIAARVTESFLEDIDEQPTVEAQPTDAEREAYIKGYDYGVKDWFKSKTQPCEDCISREAVEKLKKYSLSYDTNTTVPKTDIFVKIADIKHLPPVTPQRPKGKWIELKNKRGTTIALRCSICKKSPIRGIRSDFCPNCGSYNGGETNDK